MYLASLKRGHKVRRYAGIGRTGVPHERVARIARGNNVRCGEDRRRVRLAAGVHSQLVLAGRAGIQDASISCEYHGDLASGNVDRRKEADFRASDRNLGSKDWDTINGNIAIAPSRASGRDSGTRWKPNADTVHALSQAGRGVERDVIYPRHAGTVTGKDNHRLAYCRHCRRGYHAQGQYRAQSHQNTDYLSHLYPPFKATGWPICQPQHVS